MVVAFDPTCFFFSFYPIQGTHDLSSRLRNHFSFYILFVVWIFWSRKDSSQNVMRKICERADACRENSCLHFRQDDCDSNCSLIWWVRSFCLFNYLLVGLVVEFCNWIFPTFYNKPIGLSNSISPAFELNHAIAFPWLLGAGSSSMIVCSWRVKFQFFRCYLFKHRLRRGLTEVVTYDGW